MKNLNKILLKVGKTLLILLGGVISYFIIAIVLSHISVNKVYPINKGDSQEIYLGTNGVHLDIIIPIQDIDSNLLKGLTIAPQTIYLSFGWGDEDFYINTPQWSDLTTSTALKAMFWKSSTLMHVTTYKHPQKDWFSVKTNATSLKKINDYILNSFKLNASYQKELLVDQGYGSTDHFYKAKGSYSCLKTCNTWVNNAFKESDLPACLWTPFDFGLIHIYQNHE